jgi:hypothetical protein
MALTEAMRIAREATSLKANIFVSSSQSCGDWNWRTVLILQALLYFSLVPVPLLSHKMDWLAPQQWHGPREEL